MRSRYESYLLVTLVWFVFVVTSITGAAPVTSTIVSAAADFQWDVDRGQVAGFQRYAFAFEVLKPFAVTVMVYTPGGRLAKR